MTIYVVPPGFHPIRHDRLIQEKNHDKYKLPEKLPEPTVCPQCHAVFREGRWCWADCPPDAHQEMCPACHRIEDDFPAGFVYLSGPFFDSHRSDILNLIRHTAEREGQEHPMQRIMAEKEEGGGMLVTTTDIHLARAIGEAVHRAYKGELEFHYNRGENLLRVTWTR